MKERICRGSARCVLDAQEPKTYAKAQFIRKRGERVFLQQWADKLMYEAQLLAGAKTQEIGQQPSPLTAIALHKVFSHPQQICLLVIPSIAPAQSRVRRPGGRGGCRRRRRRPGDLFEIGCRCVHAWCRWAPRPLLRQLHIMRVKRQLLVKDCPPSLRETERSVVRRHLEMRVASQAELRSPVLVLSQRLGGRRWVGTEGTLAETTVESD